jgi:hypothetical protein
VGIEAAVGQPRFLHHVGDAEAGIAVAADGAGGGVEDAFVRLFAAGLLEVHGHGCGIQNMMALIL